MANAKVEAFLDLEASLHKKVSAMLRSEVRPILKKIGTFAEHGDFAEAYRHVELISTEGTADKSAKIARFIGLSAALFGATRLTRARETSLAKSDPPMILDNAVLGYQTMVRNIAESLRKKVTKTLEKEQERRRAQKGVVRKGFAVDLTEEVEFLGDQGALVASSLHASRLASWGFTAEAESRGVTTYRISEQLDLRTCPVCQVMHGKTFSVDSAKVKLETHLSVSDPQELAALQTWPKQDEASVSQLADMPTSQMKDNGWDTPPFHPLCRGVLLEAPEGPTIEEVPDVAYDPVPVNQKGKWDGDLAAYAKQFEKKGFKVDTILNKLSAPVRAELEGLEIRLNSLNKTTDIYRTGTRWNSERRKLHREIMRKVFATEKVQHAIPLEGAAPRYVQLGGRGGAGKSRLAGMAYDSRSAMVLNSDDLVNYLPGYDGWNKALFHDEASYLFMRATRIARSMGLNVVHDMTMSRNLPKLVKHIKAFERKGYIIEGYYMFQPPHMSVDAAVQRYLGRGPKDRGRYLPLRIIATQTENESLFDQLKQYYMRWGAWDNQGKAKGLAPIFIQGGGTLL